MEGPESYLTESEIMRLNALSGDLSIIHDHEIPDPDVAAAVDPQAVPLLLVDAYRTRNWEEVLRLLRSGETGLQPHQIAYMRSRAYEQVAELVPAIAFMDEASRRDPSRDNYKALAMELLQKDDRFAEAYQRAKRYVQTAGSDRLVLMSAGILSRAAQLDRPPTDLSSVVRGALGRIESALPGESSDAIRAAARVAFGLLADYVNDRARAASALERAIDESDALGAQFRGPLKLRLDYTRQGKSATPAARALGRTLAEECSPFRYLQAA
jgi:hypothetical protein